MSPTRIGPVLTPTPISIAGQPRALKRSFSFASSACIASAAATAWRACWLSATGAPQNAMIWSPTYLSSVPRCERMTRLIAVRNSFMNADSAFGSRPSAIEVNRRMSVKSTVRTSSLPSMLYFAGSRAISSTSSGGTYSPNRSVSSRLDRDSTK